MIVGTVDGQRLWGKELKGLQLAFVEWSPDGKLILFCTVNGEVRVPCPGRGLFRVRY